MERAAGRGRRLGNRGGLVRDVHRVAHSNRGEVSDGIGDVKVRLAVREVHRLLGAIEVEDLEVVVNDNHEKLQGRTPVDDVRMRVRPCGRAYLREVLRRCSLGQARGQRGIPVHQCRALRGVPQARGLLADAIQQARNWSADLWH